jgi:glucose-1-phosphate thymidylyltransferase
MAHRLKGIKGVVLAGGYGTRLLPLTKVINKHLLPVHRKPMIYYPIEKLVQAGIAEIMIVTGGNDAGDFLRLLGNGRDFGLDDLHYTYQEGAGGIAAALALARHFVDGDRVCVMLGDNLFQDDIGPYVRAFLRQPRGARVLLKQVPDPQRFGVASVTRGRIASIEEKPDNPKSRYAVTGVYLYDARVFEIVDTLKPSGRGELEITDVNNDYIRRGEMRFDVLDGWWTDAGTFESLLHAANLVARVDGRPARRPAPATRPSGGR